MASVFIFRIGGVSVILSIVLSFGAYALPALLPFAALLLAVFLFALYRWFSPLAPAMSLTAAVVGIAGAVIFASMLFVNGSVNSAPQNIAIWAAWFVPPLAFGYLAVRHHEAGMSRVLGIIGIIAGVFGLLNLLLTLAGGGNWQQPNEPALAPWIMGAYWLAQLPSLVWMLWSGIVPMRLKSVLRQQPA